MIILLREFASVAIIDMSMIKMLRACCCLVIHVCLWLVSNSWRVSNVILEYQHDFFEYDVVWLVISSFENLFLLTWRMLTHIQDCKESLSSLDDLLFLSSDITSMPDSMLLCRSA